MRGALASKARPSGPASAELPKRLGTRRTLGPGRTPWRSWPCRCRGALAPNSHGSAWDAVAPLRGDCFGFPRLATGKRWAWEGQSFFELIFEMRFAGVASVRSPAQARVGSVVRCDGARRAARAQRLDVLRRARAAPRAHRCLARRAQREAHGRRELLGLGVVQVFFGGSPLPAIVTAKN